MVAGRLDALLPHDQPGRLGDRRDVPSTAAGLVACYVAALPFFGNTVVADLAGTAAFFGLGALVRQLDPLVRREESGAGARPPRAS
ncbi:MAG: DUF6580 family putative transport protein [Singulisphaera sp.]